MSTSNAIAHALTLTTFALCAASCSDTHGGLPDVTDGGPPLYDESEPNDSADVAPWFGAIAPGSHLTIAGHIGANSGDFFDGFAITALGPCTVEFTLHAFTPAADLDVCVYDPFLDLALACYDSPFDPEVGAITFFEDARDFHLVVSPAFGGSDYLLEIDVYEVHAASADPAAEVDLARTSDDAALARLAAYRSGAHEDDAEASRR